MATNYFNTSDINLFPTSFRREETEGKFTSEHNFINILNSIVDKDSYVLTYNESNDLLRVVIHGYYFEIFNFKSTIGNTNPCYLKIRVEDGNYSAIVNYPNGSINNLDEGNEFRGLFFENNSTKQTAPNTTYYILQVTDQDGNIINKVRLSTDSIFYSNSRDLTTELNSKQSNLSAGDGIDSTKLGASEVALVSNYNDLLDSAAGKNVGTANKPVYVSNGRITAFGDSSDAGSKYIDNSTYKYTKATYMENGSILTGTTFFISNSEPLTTAEAKNGDFWFKYTN